MTRTSSTLSPLDTRSLLTMSLSTPGSAPAGAGIVGAVATALAGRRRRAVRG